MSVYQSSWNAQSAVALARREAMLVRIAALRALEDRSAQASAKSKPVFDKRGQLLPRERVALLLDAGAPYLPLCSLAGYMQDHKDPEKSIPGGGQMKTIKRFYSLTMSHVNWGSNRPPTHTHLRPRAINA